MIDGGTSILLALVALQTVSKAFRTGPSTGADAMAGGAIGATLFGDLLQGAMGNFTHEAVKRAVTAVRNRYNQAGKPVNHDIQRAVRKACLRATLAASQQWFLERDRQNYVDSKWRRGLDAWLQGELARVDAPDYELPKGIDAARIDVLLGQGGADGAAAAQLRQELLATMSDEIGEHTRSGLIDHSEGVALVRTERMAFVKFLTDGAPFIEPPPSLFEKLAGLVPKIGGHAERLAKQAEEARQRAAGPGACRFVWFDLVCEYFIEDFKQNDRLERILNAQFLLDLRNAPGVAGISAEQAEQAVRAAVQSLEQGLNAQLADHARHTANYARVILQEIGCLQIEQREQFDELRALIAGLEPHLRMQADYKAQLDDLHDGLKQALAKLDLVLERLGSIEAAVQQLLRGPRYCSLAEFKTRYTFAPVPFRPLCFGRQALVDARALCAVEPKARAQAVTGSGGLGKSNLLRNVLHHPRVLARYAERRLYVSCEGVSSLANLLVKTAESMGLPPTEQNLTAAILDELRSAPVLLALDNMEDPLQGDDAAAVGEFLQRVVSLEGVHLLLARRGNDLPELPWSPGEALQRLASAAARELFLDVVRTKQPAREVADEPALDELLTQLDGLPRALRIVAGQVQNYPSVAQVLAAWRNPKRPLLAMGKAPNKETQLLYSVHLSFAHEALHPAARRLARMLATLPDGLAEADVEKLIEEDDAIIAIAELKRFELVETDRPGRIRLSRPVAECIAIEPPLTGESRDAIFQDARRVDEHFLRQLREIDETFLRYEFGVRIPALLAETGNFLRVLHDALNPPRSSASGAVVQGLLKRRKPSPLHNRRMTAAFGWYRLAYFTSLDPAPLHWAIELARVEGDRPSRAYCLGCLGDLERLRAPMRAEAFLLEALSLVQTEGARASRAHCLLRLGTLEIVRARARAEAFLREALSLYEAVGDRHGRANCLHSLGDLERIRAPARAEAFFREALPLYAAVGDRHGRANCLHGLGDLERIRAPARAEAFHREALPLYEASGDRSLGRANCLHSLGDLERIRAPARAEAFYREALSLHGAVGNRQGCATCLHSLGDLDRLRAPARAEAHYREALALHEAVSDRLGRAKCMQGLGDLECIRAPAQADAYYREALPLFEAEGARQGRATCLLRFGQLALAEGDRPRAGEFFTQVKALCREVENVFGTGLASFLLGEASEELERSVHRAEAREAWANRNRDELLAEAAMDFVPESAVRDLMGW